LKIFNLKQSLLHALQKPLHIELDVHHFLHALHFALLADTSFAHADFDLVNGGEGIVRYGDDGDVLGFALPMTTLFVVSPPVRMTHLVDVSRAASWMSARCAPVITALFGVLRK
jgi:hypothetical protein